MVKRELMPGFLCFKGCFRKGDVHLSQCRIASCNWSSKNASMMYPGPSKSDNTSEQVLAQISE